MTKMRNLKVNKKRMILTSLILLVFALAAAVLAGQNSASKEVFFWDDIKNLSGTNSFFPTTISDKNASYIFYESVNEAKKEVKISWMKKEDSNLWSEPHGFSESFKYSGEDVPDLYSAAVSDGKIAVSVLDMDSPNGTVLVYVSDDGGEKFSRFAFPEQAKQVASTRIFRSGDGGFMLFVSLGEGKKNPTDSSFTLLCANSKNGRNWTSLEPFKAAENILNPFSPFLVQLNGKDAVYFEGWYEKDSSSSQIYCSVKEKNNWGTPVLVTDQNSVPSDGENSFLEYKNFRPSIYAEGTEAKICWERTLKTSGSATVMVAPLSKEGKILDRNDVESLNKYGNARRPSIFSYKGKVFVLWFDDRNGVNNVHLAENLGVQWIEHDSILRRQNNSTDFAFACPVISLSKRGRETLSLVWQQSKGKDNRICVLGEDFHVSKPELSALNFTAGKRGKLKTVSVKVIPPYDVSEIQGLSVVSGYEGSIIPSEDEMGEDFRKTSENIVQASIRQDVEGDQKIYFKAKVLDKAGNWSEISSLEYYYDVTPPLAPVNLNFPCDEYGFASSNDLDLSWEDGTEKPDEEMEIWRDQAVSYSWTLTKLSKIEKKFEVSKTKKIKMSVPECSEELEKIRKANLHLVQKIKEPPLKPLGRDPHAAFRNRENGLYAFSVRGFDAAGNAGECATILLFLNKYRAATVIKNVSAEVDDLGSVSLKIRGEEFLDDGQITEVSVIDNETGKTYLFTKENGDYEVGRQRNNPEVNEITGLKINNIREGSYTVQIKHSERGISTWNRKLVIEKSGTVKYERQYNFEPVWKIIDSERMMYAVDSDRILFWCVMVLIALGILVCSRGLIKTVNETLLIKEDVKSILRGDIMSIETRNKLEAAVKVRFSLKFKFGLFTTALLLFIVAGVALSIGSQMSRTQERILITGLKDRVKVAMGNMSSGVQTYLPDGREKLTELGSIVNQTDNFAEAEFATILSFNIDGVNSQTQNSMNFVWATNDENISSKLYEKEFDAGTVRLRDVPAGFMDDCLKINEDARKIASESLTSGSIEVFKKLNEFSAASLTSYPQMSDDLLDRSQTKYDFVWPVCYEQGKNKSKILQAAIIMQVDTKTLIAQVDSSKRVAFLIATIAAAVASVIGLICAFALASVIVNPIKRVVEHVKTITDTVDKEELDGFTLRIKSHDELRALGESVNDMTRGLVKGARDEKLAKLEAERAAKAREEAAVASERAAKAQAEEAKARAEAAEMNIMNLDGQAVQKAFIPLITSGAEKETTAELKDNDIQMYGYYEGTDAVSGDYFDYKKLDDRWYAIIKCDASGHGVPAALIMTIVATIFRRYFSNWNFKANGTKLNLLAGDINDFIESLGLRGKFAAMMICLFDTKSGDVYMCNAGDNIVHYFDSESRKIKILTLHESPAAGPLPSFMVDMKGGYKVEKFHLKKNDVLFLYTDGIEESTRFFRNSSFEVTECAEPGLKDGEIHATHKVGQNSEQMEPQRVMDIIEAVLNRKKYILTKYHSPEPGEVLEFDFTKCEGTIEETITAMTAVEKVFRMYKKPGAAGSVSKTELELDGKKKVLIQINGDGIKIDRKIDAFLAKTFSRYDYYCSERVDMDEQNYVYYTGINEDSQADDLTLLAVKKL